jgi:hypothetical protein
MEAGISPSPKFSHNHDYRQRDALLDITVDWEDEDNHGGIEYFDNIDVAMLSRLLSERYINPNDRQNESPRVSQFYEFMKRYPAARAFGYAVSPLREDYRIAIEGLFVAPDDVTAELRDAFGEFCANADEIETGVMLRGWWD